jgi:hypothetical protein
VDEHQITIAAPRDQVWTALRRFAKSSLLERKSRALALALGTEPHSGFGIAHDIPYQQLGLAGRHRFSRYLLVFEVDEVADEETLVSARTLAEFPGPHGRIYRALVIGSGAHVVAVKRMLRSIERISVG